MRFIFKLITWGFVALLILPSVSPIETNSLNADAVTSTANINTSDAIVLAVGMADDVRGMCERQPELCDIGQRVIVSAVERAREGAVIVGSMVEEHRSKQQQEADAQTTGSVQ